MLRVGICDDNLIFVNELENYLISCFEVKSLKYDISCFTDPINLLKYINQLDVIFLDVEMPTIDGFTAAKNIRAEGNPIPIIFLTNHKEKVQLGFNLKIIII